MYKLIVEDLHKKFGDNEVLKGVSMKAKAAYSNAARPYAWNDM